METGRSRESGKSHLLSDSLGFLFVFTEKAKIPFPKALKSTLSQKMVPEEVEMVMALLSRKSYQNKKQP